MNTTLNKILEHNPCNRGWGAIINYVGKDYDRDQPISFTVLLDAVGLFGSVWCLRTVKGHDDIKQQFHDFCLSGRSKEEMEIKFLELFGD